MPEPLQPSPPQILVEEKKAQASNDAATKIAHEEKEETVPTQAVPVVSEVAAQKQSLSAENATKPTGNKVTLAPLPEKTVSTGMLLLYLEAVIYSLDLNLCRRGRSRNPTTNI